MTPIRCRAGSCRIETSKLAPAAIPERAVVATTSGTMKAFIAGTSFLACHNDRPQQKEKREYLKDCSNGMPACEAVQFRSQDRFVIGGVFETEHHGCCSGSSQRMQETQ